LGFASLGSLFLLICICTGFIRRKGSSKSEIEITSEPELVKAAPETSEVVTIPEASPETSVEKSNISAALETLAQNRESAEYLQLKQDLLISKKAIRSYQEERRLLAQFEIEASTLKDQG